MGAPEDAVDAFISYAPEDDLLCDELIAHLAPDWAAESYVEGLCRMIARREGQIDTMIRYLEAELGRNLSALERQVVALRYDALGEGHIERELFALTPAELAAWLERSDTW